MKYSLGIDVAKDKLDVCLVSLDQDQAIKVKAQRKFSNGPSGFKELDSWVKKHHKEEVPLTVLLEATGVYHENLAMYLCSKSYALSIVLPTKAKRYMQALGHNSKNDKADARGLASMGAQQRFTCWQPIDSFYYELRQLTRHYQSLQETKTRHQNQLHALAHSASSSRQVVKQIKSLVTLLEKQIRLMRQAISDHLATNQEVKQKVSHLITIKGVDVLTVATVLAETGGFSLIENIGQLVSYAGYDVVENQSGNRRGKTRISKKGNSRLRRILFLPAFNVVRWQQTPFSNLYERLMAKGKEKMQAYVAVQKKLLVLLYVLWKKDEAYCAEYQEKKTSGNEESKLLFSLGCEADTKKIAPDKAGATQDEHPAIELSEALFSLAQSY